MGVDSAASKPGDLVLPLPPEEQSDAACNPALGAPAFAPDTFAPDELSDLCRAAEAEACGLTREDFNAVLAAVGARHNHGLPPGAKPGASQRAAFFRSLHLSELALAHACALGREPAWERFVNLYRNQLIRAATAIAGSAALGEELADSLYAELYGLRQRDGQRSSPLASYSGRGSLLGWLRSTLVQRYRDRLRRTRRETPLDDFDGPAPDAPAPQVRAEIFASPSTLARAVALTLAALPAEDRFLLAAYYLDRQTLLQIARTLKVHEATVSRRLKRLVAELRKRLLRNLTAEGLSKRAAEEALGADPRDVEINLRALLQTSQLPAFSFMRNAAQPLEPEP